MIYLTKLFAFLSVAFASPTVYYDFANGCSGVAGPLYISKVLAFDGTLYALSALTHQLLELTSDAEGAVSCTALAYTGAPANTFSLGMDVDKFGTFYISNTGFPQLFAGKLYALNIYDQPIVSSEIGSFSTLSLTSGVAVDEAHQRVFVSSEIFGIVYTVSTLDQTIAVFLSPQTVPLLAGSSGGYPSTTIDNCNLFGVPFGTGAIAVHKSDLYTVGIDRGLLFKTPFSKMTGNAGVTTVIASSFEHSAEGVSVSSNGRYVYFGSVFANGTSLRPDIAGEYQGGVLAGNAFWRHDQNTGSTVRFGNANYGSVTSVLDAKAVLGGSPGTVFVASSGFDSFPGWPLGKIRSGEEPFGSTNATGAALPNAYNVKIWLVDT
jgi:hypothetical protein